MKVKNVKNYEGLYIATDTGEVISLERQGCDGRTLSQTIGTDGYMRVALSKNGIKKTTGVHRILAQAFIPNPDNLPCVNHKDLNKLNNSIDNLEWCTHLYNMQHAFGNILIMERNLSRSKISKQQAVEIYKLKGVISGAKVGKQYGLSETQIYRIWNQKKWWWFIKNEV